MMQQKQKLQLLKMLLIRPKMHSTLPSKMLRPWHKKRNNFKKLQIKQQKRLLNNPTKLPKKLLKKLINHLLDV